jgi:hypothetical protein
MAVICRFEAYDEWLIVAGGLDILKRTIDGLGSTKGIPHLSVSKNT